MKAERLLEEIKSKIDIIEFISDYVNLKKSGQNYKGLCPFHTEKTPSFMVSQPKQIFHCFGCGVGGDAVSFLMKHDNFSFGEAIRYMAKKAGIPITDFSFDKESSAKRETILRINEDAMNFFMKNLQDSKTAAAYLKNRGLDNESISRFCIGYATGQRDGLLTYMRKMGHSEAFLKEAGLILADDRSGVSQKMYRDSFRGRIIFPIFNLRNDVIAFGGRVLDDALPKYINSPETEVFKKSDILFAINLAKDEIKKKGYAVIVEGYLDVIVCHQHDFRNAVAPLGTALTARQLHKLKSWTQKVVLVFDGDNAGISAARRSLAIVCENDFKAKVLLLPEGEDPDSFLRKNGSGPFKKMLADAVSLIYFILHTAKGDKTDAVKEALGMISAVKDLVIADELLRELADRSRVNESVLRNELDRIRKRPGVLAADGLGQAMKTMKREECLLLSAVIAFPEKAGYVLSKLSFEDLKDKTIKSIFCKISTLSDKFTAASLLDQADDEDKTLITELSLNPGFDAEHVDRNIEDCLQVLIQKDFEERQKEERQRLADSNEPHDVALHNALLKEKRRLVKRISS
jgi:DNA primase